MEKRKALSLEDLLPAKPEFKLKGRTYVLRPPNMLDQVWIKQTWGDAFANILPEENWPQVARFVYHQMSHEDQTHFRARKGRIVNELTGEEAERFFTSAEVLLESISNQQEMLGVLAAVYRAIVISNPIVEEIAKKKMGAMLEAINNPPPPPGEKSIGAKSSTPSRTNTGGARKKSRS